MKQYFGLRPTGRQFKDSGSTLVELVDDAELRHTAIVLFDPFLQDADLGLDFRGVLSFLEYPMVTGLVELRHHDLLTGVFVYPTGPMWTIRELLRMSNDRRQPLGLRAALEIGILGAQILVEASETGSRSGCFSHGSLNPWRIALKPDGELQVFGYGVPQVELVAFQRDPSRVPPPDAVRYVPPERLAGEQEELASDTFALMLMVAEAATGRRLHDDQHTEPLIEAIKEGDTVKRVHRLGLSRRVAALFAKGLGPEIDARLTGPALVEALGAELEAAEGPSLEQVMEDVLGHRRESPRRASPLVAVSTDIVDRRPASEDPRWRRPVRGSEDEADEADEADAPATTTTSSRRRRSAEATPPPVAGPLRRPRRQPRSDPGDAPQPPPPPAAATRSSQAEPARPRRTRTGTFARPTPIGDRIPTPGEREESGPDDATRVERRPRQPRRPRQAAPTPEPRASREGPRRPRATGPEDLPTDVGDFELPPPPRARRGARPPGRDRTDEDES